MINSGRTVDGDLEAFNKMFDMANAGLAGDAEYQAFAEILDIDAFIDYMILNQYGGNLDWDSHNWYVIRRREPGGKFYWIAWDSEFIFIDNDHNVLEFDRAAYSVTPCQHRIGGPGGIAPTLKIVHYYCIDFTVELFDSVDIVICEFEGTNFLVPN